MKLPAYIPSPHLAIREGIIVLGGALFAALVIGQMPGLKAWIKEQWAGAKP